MYHQLLVIFGFGHKCDDYNFTISSSSLKKALKHFGDSLKSCETFLTMAYQPENVHTKFPTTKIENLTFSTI